MRLWCCDHAEIADPAPRHRRFSTHDEPHAWYHLHRADLLGVACIESHLHASRRGSIGARTYIEQRLLHKKRSIAPSDQPADLVTLLDREAARVENAWSGFIFIILALATITFTSAYFFVALGLSALAALSVILASSAVIYWNAKQLNAAHAALSLTAADRIEVGMFSLNNRLLAWLKNWNDELFRRYADKRDGEERALLKAARLIARINLISTLTPIVAMLAAVFTQLAHVGYVDPAGLLSTMALVGA